MHDFSAVGCYWHSCCRLSFMRPHGSLVELEHRRVLAVERLVEGYSVEEIADFLDVDPSSVRRWRAAFRRHSVMGLAARSVSGRPPKLSSAQEKIVRRWFSDSPLDHGFSTELWTASRLATLIAQEWNISFHPHYLARWLVASAGLHAPIASSCSPRTE